MRPRSSRPRVLRLSWLFPLVLLLTIVLPAPVLAASAQAAAAATTSVATSIATTLATTSSHSSTGRTATTTRTTTAVRGHTAATGSAARTSRTAGPAALSSPPSVSGLGVFPSYPLVTYGLTDRLGLAVNVANGNLLVQATDLVIRGTGLDLVVNRTYNNLSSAQGSIANRWSLSVGNDVSLQFPQAGTVIFVGPSGAQSTFTQNPDRSYASPPGMDATLVKNGDGSYTLTFHASGVQDRFRTDGLLAATVDRNGNTLAFTYGNPNDPLNPGNGLAAITDSQGRVTGFLYNGLGFIGTMTDPAGRTFQYGGNGNGNLGDTIDQMNRQTQFQYDVAFSTNNLQQITDPNGNVTTLAYDSSNRITALTFGAGSSVAATYTYTYNPGSTVVTDPNNYQTTYTFDSAGRATQVTDALGNSQHIAWTADDHLAQTTDALGHTTTYGYDQNNNLTQVTLPTGATTSAVYGTVANVPDFFVPTSTTDAQGNTTSDSYDGNGNVTSVTDALAGQNRATYAYNANGTVASATDFTGNTTSYGYDAKGNLTTITPPSPMGATTIVPDALSRPSSVTDGKGQQRSYTYDPLDRVTALTYPADSAGNVSSAYDSDGNATSMTDSTGTTSYQYDARNRQTLKTLPAALGGGSFAYGYDAASNLTSMTDSASVPGNPLTVSYGYNAANLVTSLQDPSGTTSFGYDANDQRVSTTFPDGVVQSQAYDASQRLSSIAGKNGGTTLTSFTYRYTKPGGGDTLLPWTVAQTTTSPNNTTVTNATVANNYDALNRLTQWQVTNSTTGALLHNYVYQYDGNSNRTQIIADPVNSQNQIVANPSQGLPHSNESDLSFNAPSELAQIQPYSPQGQSLTPVAYSYDPAGNQTGNNGGGTGKPLTISYAPTNQTQSVSDINQNAETMTWAGAGQAERVKRTWSDQGTNYSATYAWSQLGLSGYSNTGIDEPTQTSAVTSWIVRDPSGTPIAQRYSNGQESYYLFDGQGNVAALEDPGVIQAAYDYCPTGNNPALPGTPMTTVSMANPLRQGQIPYDDSTKLYVGPNGALTPDYSGVGTQGPGMRFGDAIGSVPLAEHLSGEATVCATLTVGLIYYGSVSACQTISLHGPTTGQNTGGTFSLSGGHIVGATASLTVGLGYSSASSVKAMGGPFGTAGISGGEVVVGGVDSSVGAGGVLSNTASVGVGFNISPIAGLPIEIHGGGGKTWTISFK
jgi:YD repeat-containing protein